MSIDIPPLVNLNLGEHRRARAPEQRSMIQCDPGFTSLALRLARERQLDADDGDATVKHLWPLENRKTNQVDCVLGPCTFDDMVESWAVLEGGERPIAQMRVIWRW